MAKKKKAKPFINPILEGYIQVLLEYCEKVCGKADECGDNCPLWKFNNWLSTGKE